MASERRRGVESSKSRALLVQAAEEILRDEGFIAVSARRVADRAGLKPQLVHYYFETMDDLLLAVARRGHERRNERHAQVVASSRPLHALWEMSNDPSTAALMAEFTALAIHREAIRDEIVRAATEYREVQAQTIRALFDKYGVDSEANGPAGIAFLMATLPRALASEVAVGLTAGHAEAEAIVMRLLDTLEPPGPAEAG